MTDHRTGTREEWLAARLELLEAEKEYTRLGDELAKQRQSFRGSASRRTTVRDRRGERVACGSLPRPLAAPHVPLHVRAGVHGRLPVCSTIADGFDGFVVHLENHDVGMMAVSQAPLEALQAYKRRMGWRFPWASSHGSDFNFDFHVSFTEEQQRANEVEYNYRPLDTTPILESPSEGLTRPLR